MRHVIELVLRQQVLHDRYVLLRNIADDGMLVRRQPEGAPVDLGDLAQPSLEVASGLILHAPVLDKAREMVQTVVALDPAKVVDVAVEGEGARWWKRVAQELLDFAFEDVQTHAVDCVFQTCILSES